MIEQPYPAKAGGGEMKKSRNTTDQEIRARAGADATPMGRRTFLGASAAAIAGAVIGRAPSASAASSQNPAPAAASDAPTFDRVRFEGEKMIDGPSVRVHQAGIRMIPVAGGKYRVWTQRVGNGGLKVLALHGGPGMTHEYLVCLQDFLPTAGYELYFYDQLGCGNSDHPEDDSLWTVERYRTEVEEVRAGLGLTDFVLYGHSWGGMLVQEYAVTYPHHLKAAVISNMTASMKSYVAHINALRKTLPKNVQAVMAKYEAEKKFDAPEYQEVLLGQVYHRFMCRLDPWPEPLMISFNRMNAKIYNQMQGPSEFVITGNYKDWNRWPDLHGISVPTLLIAARHGTMSVDDIQKMGRLIPNSRVAVCENGSHLAMYDDQQAYFDHLLAFLADVRAGKPIRG
jgi:proline iminopeptidase